MSQFYGTVSGQARTDATRRGSKRSGIVTYAAGWGGAIRVDVSENEAGEDIFYVSLVPWQSSGGQSRELASGKLDARAEA